MNGMDILKEPFVEEAAKSIRGGGGVDRKRTIETSADLACNLVYSQFGCLDSNQGDSFGVSV